MQYGPYSPSRLDTATCGFAFYKQYIDPDRKRRERENVPQARGSAVHEVFELITRRLCENPEAAFSDAEVRDWVVQAVSRHPAAYSETGEILDMAKRYIRRPPEGLVKDSGIELRLAVKTLDGVNFQETDYEDGMAFARGRADIMVISDDTTSATIYDHKTQPNTEEADTFQMGFYAWVISKIYPFLNEIKTVLHFARYGTYSMPYVWGKRELAAIEDELLTRIAIIEGTARWEAQPHKNCQYCPFMDQCPVMGEFVERTETGEFVVKPQGLKILGDTSKAVKLAGALTIFEEYVKKIKAELREHTKEYGPVAIPGRVYGFRAEEKIDWNYINKYLRDNAYSVFDKYGVDPKRHMSFNQSSSQGIWLEENEGLLRELATLFPRRTVSEFGGHKA